MSKYIRKPTPPGKKPRAEQVYHGMRQTPTYNTWYSMLDRCRNPANGAWKFYGARGIKVCKRWETLANFVADMGMRPEGKTLDRRDSNGNYEPGNCRWATELEQQRNRRHVKCNMQIAADIRAGKYEGWTHKRIAALFGGDVSTISRIKSGEIWR